MPNSMFDSLRTFSVFISAFIFPLQFVSTSFSPSTPVRKHTSMNNDTKGAGERQTRQFKDHTNPESCIVLRAMTSCATHRQTYTHARHWLSERVFDNTPRANTQGFLDFCDNTKTEERDLAIAKHVLDVVGVCRARDVNVELLVGKEVGWLETLQRMEPRAATQ